MSEVTASSEEIEKIDVSDESGPIWSEEAEQAVLGGLLRFNNPTEFNKVVQFLASSYFFRRDHGVIFRTIYELTYTSSFSLEALIAVLRSKKLLRIVGGTRYLRYLMDDLFNPKDMNIKVARRLQGKPEMRSDNLMAYAEIVRTRAHLRRRQVSQE